MDGARISSANSFFARPGEEGIKTSLARERYDLAGIHQVFRVDGVLQGRHEIDRFTQFLPQGLHLAETDPVLAGAGAFHGESAVHDSLVERLGLGELGFAVRPDKDLTVEVAVPDVAEEGDRHRGALDVLRGLDYALRQARNRDA